MQHLKKYLALYMASAADFEKMVKESTSERQRRGMQERKWADQHRGNIAELGAPLGKTKKVTQGASTILTTKSDTIVRANSHDEAARIFADSAHFMMPGSWVEVMEIRETPPM